MAEPLAQAGLRTEERRGHRRVGALLNQYYAIEGAEGAGRNGAPAAAALESELDRQGFDAKRYFDGVVASGHLPELVQRTEDLEREVRELDGTMQMLVYENYSKFIRATDVIRHMKGTIEGLGPDLRRLEGSMGRAAQHQDRVEEGVSGRAQQVERLLRQQRVCRKLQVLFALPGTLQRCLKHNAYAQAVQAYRCCEDVLRQHRDVPAFQNVLEEADLHMSRIRGALESCLRSPDLSVDDAVSSAATLRGLGEDQGKVAREYISGRVAMLEQSCRQCFAEEACLPPEAASSSSGLVARSNGVAGEAAEEGGAAAASSREEQEQQRPESLAFRGACLRAAELHVPRLCDAVEGLRQLLERGASEGDGAAEEVMLPDFVRKQLGELFEQISRLVKRRCPPARVLVSCIACVQESLRRLQPLLPGLLSELFAEFSNRVAGSAARTLFSSAAASLVSSLCQLHGECHRLQETGVSGLDEVLEDVARTEQALIMCSFTAINDCQPLLGLVGSGRPARQQLVQGVHGQLITLFLAFIEACHVCVGHDIEEPHNLDSSLPVMARAACTELEAVAALRWCGLFGLALVRIGRHLEVQLIAKIWDVARDLFASGDFSAAELTPHPAVIKATRTAAQAVITHYAFLHGQRLAGKLGEIVRLSDGAASRDAWALYAVVEEVHTIDAQLSRILGDPRKAREASHHRLALNHCKNSMELEMERLWAKKLQVFAPIPFNRNGAILGVLRIAFKALYEHAREQTFTKSGLQQLQVDCAFLLEAVRDFVEAEDAGVLESLLDEAVTSASQRCREPELLEASVVEALCEERKKRGPKLES